MDRRILPVLGEPSGPAHQTLRTIQLTLITELTGPDDEGMRVWVKHYRRALSTAGHEVSYLELGGLPNFAAGRVSTLARVARSRPDVIQYVPYSGLTPASLLRMRLLGLAAPRAVRSIAVLQAGTDGMSAPPGCRADVALFASQRLRAATGDIATTNRVLYPIVDLERFRPAEGDALDFKAEHAIPADRPMVLHVGHLKPRRNLDVLADLARTGEWSVVMIASTSTEEDPKTRATLERAGVHVIREYLHDIERAYRAADVYVFPVRSALGSIEVPLSVVEARGCGTPVIATPFGALPELFADGGMVTYAETKEFAGRIRDLLADPPADSYREELEVFRSDTFVREAEGAFAASKTPLIVLSGVDGAGKSTQIERLTTALRERGQSVETLWCRWDPLLVKPAVKLLGVLARRRRRSASSSVNSATTEPAARRGIRAKVLDNRLMAAAWRALMVVDYGLRLAPKVRRARRRNDIVLLDRYWHDVMVDYSFGRHLREPPRALARLLPAPDGVVILDVDEDTALARKSDTPDREYLTERRRLYAELAARYDGRIVDAAREPDAVFADLLGDVTDIAGLPADPPEAA